MFAIDRVFERIVCFEAETLPIHFVDPSRCAILPSLEFKDYHEFVDTKWRRRWRRRRRRQRHLIRRHLDRRCAGFELSARCRIESPKKSSNFKPAPPVSVSNRKHSRHFSENDIFSDRLSYLLIDSFLPASWHSPVDVELARLAVAGSSPLEEAKIALCHFDH